LANSSAQEAVSTAKADDCRRAGEAVVALIKRGIKPSDILSKESFAQSRPSSRWAGRRTPCCTCLPSRTRRA
jgi:hypothetical protein